MRKRKSLKKVAAAGLCACVVLSAQGAGSLAAEMKSEAAKTEAPDVYLPESSSRYLEEEEVEGWTRGELEYARYEIFARRGMLFDDPEIAEYFSGKSWYFGFIKESDFPESMLNEYELANAELLERLAAEFLVDDHSFWDLPGDSPKTPMVRQTQWSNNREKVQTEMETMGNQQDEENKSMLEQIQVANRDDVDYRTFLRRFAVPREVMAVDGDAFDYIFYTYGLQLYGNMPLVEPPETKEEKRIEDFVIAVDTSMSTSGELVRQFLACTYAILRSTETFTRKVNIRILQCDDQVRSDTPIRDLEELKAYMENFSLMGGSATDFRPVFEHVAELQVEGAFTFLRGLVYFTDGMGVYPRKRPPYDTAFVLLEEPPLSVKMPPWAIRLVVPTPALEQAAREAAEEAKAAGLDLIDLDELPQL